MKEIKQEIKKGITVHQIKTNSFKTDLVAVFLMTKLDRETVTKNAIIPMVLRKGTKSLEDSQEINKKLEEMYGAGFECGIDKTGDNQVLRFYIETLDNAYLPEKEDLLSNVIQLLLEIIFDPKTENNAFKEEYLDSEKEKLKNILEGKKDDKAVYANLRCQEEMYNGTPFGLYKYGYIEDIEGINAKDLYEYYKNLIASCKIDIFVSGNIDEKKVLETISNNENIKKLEEREPNVQKGNAKLIRHEEKEIIEHLEVTQGNLVIGLEINENSKREKYVATVYNAILGGSATSKMFQVVREQHSLAYTAASNFLRHKNSIFIRAGIEIENYEKTVKLIKEQLEDMKSGNFTDEDIENAKTGIISMIKSIPDEQETAVTYYYGQEVGEHKLDFDEYESEINSVTKEEIMDFANKISVNTVYFLRD